MNSAEVSIPPAVRVAFQLYLAAVAVSSANAVAQVYFAISRPPVLLNPVFELALFLAIGRPMRRGKVWARLGMFTLALLLILLNLVVTYGLTRAFGSLPTYQVLLLLVLVGGKVALLGAATWMMYRPRNQVYFG